MIPSIETILTAFRDGHYTLEQSIGFIEAHLNLAQESVG
jgi:hypothetical protein